MTSVELGFRIAAVALLAFTLTVWLRDLRNRLVGPLGALFFFCVISYLLCPPLARDWQLGVFEIPFFIGCFGAAPVFWLFSRAIFDDQFQVRWWHGAIVLAMELLGIGHRLSKWDAGVPSSVWGDPQLYLFAHQIASLAITLSALMLALSGWRDDLVEMRRRFRLVLVAVAGGYILAVVVTEIYLRNGPASSLVETINAALISVLAFGFALSLVRVRSDLVPVEAKSPAMDDTGAEDAVFDELYARLIGLMEDDFAYREEGLTIGQLAERLDTQEYLLRRLINRRMSFRNFNEFLNSYRITEICRRLEDPGEVRIPILTMALESGFSSLGPFNRAFKEMTGTTPTAYRATRSKAR